MTESKAVRRDGSAEKRTSPVTFYRQVVAELRKVVWPTQEQLVTYFVVTMVFVLVFMTLSRCSTSASASWSSRSSPARTPSDHGRDPWVRGRQRTSR